MNTLLKDSGTADGPVNAGAADDDLLVPTALTAGSLTQAPTENCYALDRDGRLLIGAYPRTLAHLEALIDRNVRCFVNLTNDRLYEGWLAADAADSVEFVHLPLPRRDNVASDARLIMVCRHILQWCDDHPTDERIYVHSELGYGRAGAVAAVLLGSLEHLQTNRAIACVEQRRATLRGDYDEEQLVPTPETNVQVEQVFRLLGNPQQASGEESDNEGIRAIAKENKEQACSATFVAILPDGTTPTSSGGGAEEEVAPKGSGGEYVPLPDRSNQSWRTDADAWIKERKRARKAFTKERCENAGTKRKRVKTS